MRTVNFPEKFDIYEFCSDDIKSILKNQRDSLDNAVMEENNSTEMGERKVVGPLIPPSFDGTYELFGVVSHKV